MVDWIWDENKNAENRRKHCLGFETAVLVFEDEHVVSRPDAFHGEERWNTVGEVAHMIIFVVHTEAQTDGGTGRIISARNATAYERKAYEEGEF